TGDASNGGGRDSFSVDGVFVAAGNGSDGVFVAAGNGSDGVSVAAGVGADSVSVASSDATDAETEFALMGLSPQAKIDNMNNKVKLEESEASPRVNGYLVKALSNPFLFFDSPLPGVNTPWDVMRIVCNPDLMDIMLLQWFFDAASSMLLVRGILKLPYCCCWFKVSPSASFGFVFLRHLVVALAVAHSQVSILKLTSADLSKT
ncbi:hypothetical protein Tco_1230399, partial [Tanacetum coccineum]